MADEDEDVDFVERFIALKTEQEKQIAEEAELNKAITAHLANIKY